MLTAPTNLYDQSLVPSLDYLLSFHVGLFVRVSEAQKGRSHSCGASTFLCSLAGLGRSGNGTDQAEEAEDLQGVGVRCRECLIQFARSMFKPEMVASGQESPKRSDFVGMVEVISNHIAKGGSAERLRAHLRKTAKTTWDLAQWLVHAQEVFQIGGRKRAGSNPIRHRCVQPRNHAI